VVRAGGRAGGRTRLHAQLFLRFARVVRLFETQQTALASWLSRSVFYFIGPNVLALVKVSTCTRAALCTAAVELTVVKGNQTNVCNGSQSSQRLYNR
jgi:hypothetical protein